MGSPAASQLDDLAMPKPLRRFAAQHVLAVFDALT